MQEFIFPGGNVWVLDDTQELAVARIEDGAIALLLFSDDDLATTYAETNKLAGKVAKAVNGYAELFKLLTFAAKSGISYVVVDHTPGKPAPATDIGKAMKNVREQLG